MPCEPVSPAGAPTTLAYPPLTVMVATFCVEEMHARAPLYGLGGRFTVWLTNVPVVGSRMRVGREFAIEVVAPARSAAVPTATCTSSPGTEARTFVDGSTTPGLLREFVSRGRVPISNRCGKPLAVPAIDTA